MIELDSDKLKFSFPEVHSQAKLSISFQRTLRIPDDGRAYPLPPGFGNFPLRHIDDYAKRLPDSWLERAGVIMPMYQREALWIYFEAPWVPDRDSAYPFAVKVYTGKINAVTGKEYRNGLHGPKQDYLVIPGQPWLDGYCVEDGVIRQFVAMPLGRGYTAEEQITGEAEWGGIQIVVYPMLASEYERRFPRRQRESEFSSWGASGGMKYCLSESSRSPMGIAPGGRMKQDIYRDPFDPESWDQSARSRCFVHMLNSQDWMAVTGENPPSTPVNAKAYTHAGYPWFDYYDEDLESLSGSKILHGLKSIAAMKKSKEIREADDDDLPLRPKRVVKLGPADRRKVREGNFWDESV